MACLALVLAGGAQVLAAAWIPAKAAVAQVLLERAYVQSVETGEPVKPWPWADTAPLARVAVPRLGESAIVLSGASGQALAFGPTQVPTPSGSGVTVLAAHRDTHFAFMRELRVGDVITTEDLDGASKQYEVTSLHTVRWDRFAVPGHMRSEWLVLATCYPFNAETRGPLRRIAWARRTS